METHTKLLPTEIRKEVVDHERQEGEYHHQPWDKKNKNNKGNIIVSNATCTYGATEFIYTSNTLQFSNSNVA